jgi:hypothetical protein
MIISKAKGLLGFVKKRVLDNCILCKYVVAYLNLAQLSGCLTPTNILTELNLFKNNFYFLHLDIYITNLTF